MPFRRESNEEQIMEKPLVSVIVPIYRVERYLSECVESIIAQTYQHIEIILVDDCSPDRCGAICDKYAKQDIRVKVVHRSENGGLAAARNSGIDVAEGQFIIFVDSDDWLALDTIHCLMENMEKYSADCCAGACVTVLESEDGSLEYKEREHVQDRCESGMEAMKRLLLRESSACNRLYRRDAFAHIRFPEGRINEDEPVVLRLYSKMDRIVFLDKDTYFYRKRKNSITTSAFSFSKLDCVVNSKENLEFVKKTCPELIPAAEFKYIKSMLWCYVNLRKIKTMESRKARQNLRHKIRKNRKVALRNPHLGFLLKILAMLCSL